jgi:hypothetical protein
VSECGRFLLLQLCAQIKRNAYKVNISPDLYTILFY